MTLSAEELDAIWLSIRVALWAVAMGIIPAVLCALLLARCSFKGKTLVDAAIHLPLVVPPVVTGYLLIIALGRNTVLGGFFEAIGLQFAFNWKGAVLASLVMSFPLMVRAIRLSIEAVDTGLESAARTLGAGRLKIFLTITLPLSIPGIITGSVLAFARSLGEFGATITFVSNIPGETQTLPLALYSFTQTPDGEGMAARLCVIAIIISVTALACSEVIARRAAKRISG
ncbi:molybdate ABC transporter permease subunit [Pelobacter seleniigenes]|uniref:molybdate ABC transporter permease subunit n=1 Tax=Pelobacter seleniigenes TaxID=407188 RepID=UPI0004A6B38D|nr:molybdate ABC transporter permease subunit [Pelobacter seleniigenes]